MKALPQLDRAAELDIVAAILDGFDRLFRAREERMTAAIIAALAPAVEPFRMLSVAETCEFFGVDRKTLTAWERGGWLAPFRSGRVILYDTREIDRWVRSRQQPAAGDEARAAAA